MAKKLMRILGGYISHLSLCAAGANNIQTVYKSEAGDEETISISCTSKGMTEQGEIYSAVYVPELVDLQGDLASKEAIKQLAYSFSKAGKGIDIRHDEKVMPKDAVYVAESFIIPEGHPQFKDMKTYEGNPVDVTGGWGVVVKVDDPELRKLYRSGEWQGISMGGVTAKRPESTLGQVVKEINVNAKEETDMEAKEMLALLTENNKSLVTLLAPAFGEAVTKALTPEKPEEETKKELGMGLTIPVLPDGATTEHIEHFGKCLKVYEISQTVDRTDMDSILKYQAAKEAIMAGKPAATVTTKAVADPWGFQLTNQDLNSNTQKNQTGDVVSLGYNIEATSELSDVEVKKMLEKVPARDEPYKMSA